MAIQVQIGDTGQIAEFPDGTPPEQIESALRQQLAQPEAVQQPFAQNIQLEGLPPQAREAVLAQQRALQPVAERAAEAEAERQRQLASLPPERRAFLESISPVEAGLIGMGKGFKTIGRAVGLADQATEFEKQSFEELKAQQPAATTTGEVLGEAAPFVAPGLGIAAIPARAGQIAATAALGATEAGLIAKGEERDVGEQFKAAGIGATVAGALEVAIPVIGRIGGKVIRKALGRAPKGAVIDAAGKPSKELVDALAEQGQTFDDVVREAQGELRKKAVEPREAARKAFLKSQGLDPTRAQVTRNAADFQSQQEAAKTSSRVRDALEKQEAILTSRFDNAVLETGGTSASPTVGVVDALTEKATKLDQEIGDLYSAAREIAPGEKNIKFNNLTKQLKSLAPADRRSGGNISAIVGDMQSKGILDKKMNVIGKVDVETAEDLRKLTNELYDPQNPFGNMLLRQVKDKLDDDVLKASGKDFFQQGRKAKAAFEKELSRAKISKFDSRKANLVRDVLENKIDPDQLTDKVVFGKAWRDTDLKQLKDYISTDEAGKAAFNDMRAEVMQKIKDKAFIGPADEAGFQALSRDKLQRAINSIGDKKLKVLFTPQENKFLKDMMQIAKLREPVRGTALGRGPSAQAIGRLESAIRENPILRTLLDSVSFDVQGRAVLRSKPTAITQPVQRLPITPAIAPAAVAATQQEQ